MNAEVIDKKEFRAIKKDLDDHSEKKIMLNNKSRQLVRLSKQLIYATNRGQPDEAAKHLKEIKKRRGELDKIASTPKLRYWGPYQIAVQEYVEALAFHQIITKDVLPKRKPLKAESDTYVMGLSDLTGELVRKAVDHMIGEKYEDALKLREVVADIYSNILGLDLDGGEARRKTDQIKWNLNKLDDLIFEAKIRDKI
ncbi:MAG: hypothetical protein GF334_10580 [Candidatus Altiarchaeales archaeon]|nr:hypothetical protein [Candidatus Altiarchaeales archaeon]